MNTLLQGFLIGIANIIPGVSGGTMALMLGIYQRLLRAITHITPQAAKETFESLNQGIPQVKAQLIKLDLLWLMTIGLGAVTAIVATSKLITYLIVNWHDPTYGFFLGLVLVSIIVPIKMLKHRPSKLAIICLILAFFATLAITTSMSGSEKLANAQKKQALVLEKAASHNSQQPIAAAGNHDLTHLAYLFIAGAIAISAMILPGISGAFVLLLLGVYFEILEAIAARDLLVIGIVACGCGIGLLVFTRLLNYVLEKFHDETVMLLVGLMIGSLYGLWPFQNFQIVGTKRIDIEPIIPSLDGNFFGTLAGFTVAAFLVFVFIKLDRSSTISK